MDDQTLRGSTARSDGARRDEIEHFNESRRRFLKAGVGSAALATGGFTSAFLALFDAPAFADQELDVQILQTVAAVENLAVSTYDFALTLPFIGGAEATTFVRDFITETRADHRAHAAAVNEMLRALGAPEQTAPNPVLLEVVDAAKPGLGGPMQVINLAIQLENGAAQTYVASINSLENAPAKALAASIMGIEGQHVAILNILKALLDGNAALLSVIPMDTAQLPAVVGTVGFPEPFYKTNMARRFDEGVVK